MVRNRTIATVPGVPNIIIPFTVAEEAARDAEEAAWVAGTGERKGNEVDNEADRRIDKAFSPDNPSRAGRVRDEMPPGPERVALDLRATAFRTAAQTLRDSLVSMTPEGVLAVDPTDDIHWPE